MLHLLHSRRSLSTVVYALLTRNEIHVIKTFESLTGADKETVLDDSYKRVIYYVNIKSEFNTNGEAKNADCEDSPVGKINWLHTTGTSFASTHEPREVG